MTRASPIQALLRLAMAAVLLSVVSAVIFTNVTLRSVEKNLPNTLLEQIEEVSNLITGLGDAVAETGAARAAPTPEHIAQLAQKIAEIQNLAVAIRETYVLDNLVAVSALHAIVAPAVADAGLWLAEGVSGYDPQTAVTLEVVHTRISEAYQKARLMYVDSQLAARRILNDQRARLDRFLFSVNILFVLTLLIAVFMILLIIRQNRLHRREVEAQADRKRAEEALRESEHRFRQLAELLPQIVFEMDTNATLTFANRNAFSSFGFNPGELQRGMHILDMIAPEDREKSRRFIQDLLTGEKEVMGERLNARKRDGTVFPALAYANTIVEANRIIGIRGIVIDISEHVRLREERDRLKEQYSQSQKMEAVGLLAGGVAHDLNNMLSPILGYGELLLRNMSPGDPHIRSVEKIHQAGLRARDLIRQLLAFSRKQTLEVKPLDLNQLIGDFYKLLRRTIREDIQIQTRLLPDLPPLLADPGQIEQVIMNLAVNAQDAMPAGGELRIETGMITVAETQNPDGFGLTPGRHIVMRFSDTGFGMDEETRQRIFEPFFTTKEKGRGTGLGLSTVYGIVKQHGGSIQVASSPDQGTTFTCCFPVMVADTQAIEPPKPEIAQPQGTETIMVVEDDDEVRDLAVTILRMQGYTVLSAPGGGACLNLLDGLEHPIDLLLSDVVMPDINGRALCAKVAERFPDMKVLFMSGYTDDVITHHGVLEQGISLIHKPFTVQGLATRVREVLDGHPPRQAT